MKASLVFLRRFTEAEADAWEAAWTVAHATLDAGFDGERGKLVAAHAPRVLTGGDAEAARLLGELAALGCARTPPAWRSDPPPPYPKGIGPTRLAKPG